VLIILDNDDNVVSNLVETEEGSTGALRRFKDKNSMLEKQVRELTAEREKMKAQLNEALSKKGKTVEDTQDETDLVFSKVNPKAGRNESSGYNQNFNNSTFTDGDYSHYDQSIITANTTLNQSQIGRG
jgi:hypothetical protein